MGEAITRFVPRSTRLGSMLVLMTVLGFPIVVVRAAAPGDAAAAVPLFEGLGKHHRKVTTASREAQRYFDQGLNFLYAFNHDEAIRSFKQAAVADPRCAMAYWGIATANGPHINFPFVPPDRAATAWEAVTHAQQLAADATPVEQTLIGTLAKRYANPQPEDRRPLDVAYAAAMRQAWQQFPNDGDIGALFAEALMDLRPWDLWTVDGKPQPETPEIVSTLEAVLKQSPRHPMALHLYIHAVEASPTPEKAEAAADRLRNLTPGLGHLVHMPSHIDIRLGKWQQAVQTNQRAIEVDRRYSARSTRQDFYRIYMAHNRHMLAFAAMMQGESGRATTAIAEMLERIPAEWKEQNAALIDGFFAMPYELLVRFGRWDELLAQPEPPASFPITRALRHEARGVALAALGRVAEARASQQAFRDAVAKTPKEATFGNNTAADLFAIADGLLEGELLFREGKKAEGLAAMREAVRRNDRLRYDEPPDWILPARHSLGASLLAAGEAAEAEQVYHADLRQWPKNGWALYGLAQSLEAQGKREEAARVRKQFQDTWKHADVQITSSCYCQPGAH